MIMDQEQLETLTTSLCQWMQERLEETGAQHVVIGISGGKDSSVVAALACRAFGKERVIGVMMPEGEQKDISYAQSVCALLGIRRHLVNIKDICQAFYDQVTSVVTATTKQTKLNLPPRVRMALLYAIAQSVNGAVVNTSNLSEDWVGYATIYGDTAGAFSPLGALTTDEVVQLGRHLGLAEEFITKPPSDGLTGKTDEVVLGFTYEVLNKYIREGICDNEELRKRIDHLHKISRFKFKILPIYQPGFPIKADDVLKLYTP